MAVTKQIVCLANSRKLQGRCIAGKELIGSRVAGWIRPVSNREHEEVSEQERQYLDGSDPRTLDIMRVPLLQHQPRGYQQENWLLDPDQYWERAGRATWGDLARLADTAPTLWINGFSTQSGRNDKIPLDQAKALRTSLLLVHADRIALSVFRPGEPFGNPKRRVQGRFWHQRVEYRLWVTTPSYERRFLAMEDGDYELGESYLTISLGEPHQGACFKLIAAIVERGREDDA